MTEWLLHMTEERRAEIAAFLSTARDLLAEGADVWTFAHRDAALPTSVRRAYHPRFGSRSTIVGGLLTLRATTSISGRRRTLCARGPTGPAPDDTPDGRIPIAHVLAGWLSGLSRPITPASRAVVAEISTASSLRLRGVAELLDPAWGFATLQSYGQGRHLVTVGRRNSAGSGPVCYDSGGAGGRRGRLTDPLVAELDRIIGGSMHAHSIADVRPHMVHLVVGQPPGCVVRNEGDPMLALRAINALPSGAKLVGPDGG